MTGPTPLLDNTATAGCPTLGQRGGCVFRLLYITDESGWGYLQGYPQAQAQPYGAAQAQTYGAPQMPQAYGAPQVPQQAYGMPQQGYVATGQYVGVVPGVVMGAQHPYGAQPYSVETTESYIGPATICIAIVLCVLLGPLGLIACCMPCDQRRVTHIVTG